MDVKTRIENVALQIHELGSLLGYQTNSDPCFTAAGDIFCEMAEEVQRIAEAVWDIEKRAAGAASSETASNREGE